MTNLVLASNNKKKIAELQTLLGGLSETLIHVQSLKEIGYTDDIVEEGTSFEENSLIKAGTPAKLGYIGIADDSGLAVDVLDGAPGVYSARYSGEGATDERNRAKLLRALDGVPAEQRTAHFICTAALVLPENSGFTIPEEWQISAALSEASGLPRDRAMVVRGECQGRILTEETGEGGFGYDCLFYSPNYNKTFAEISGEEKNKVSHRGRAMREFTRRLAILFRNEGRTTSC
ncbi:MAG: non-canonical purine NTP pyrophosphatase [Eubacteriales bacterium]